MIREKGLSYDKYIRKVRDECKKISNWPKIGAEQSLIEYAGYCPFDMTPGYIAEYLGEYPSWAVSFEEKGFKHDAEHCFSIELPIGPYKDLVNFTNVRDENFQQWDLDIKLGDFLGELGDKLILERELLELGKDWPKILVERLVAVAVDDQIAVWGLSIVRELAYFEVTEGLKQVLHVFGVERYTENEFGIEQNWYREWEFNRKIEPELLRFPSPIFLCHEAGMIGGITRRNLPHC